MSKQRYWEKAITALLEKRVISTKHQSLIDEIGEILAKHDQEQEQEQEQEPVSENSIPLYTAPPKQEPVSENSIPLYTAPPKQEPLNDEWIKNNIHYIHQDVSFTELVRAIEKAHGIGVE